jgi:hypothetical protein
LPSFTRPWVTELYFGETHCIVLQFLECQKKKVIRIMEGCGNRVSCRNLFKKLQILLLESQYLLSLLIFVVQNKNLYLTNIDNHNIDTRQRNNLYLPQATLTIYQKGAHYSWIKIFNKIILEIQNVADNPKKFKTALKQFLYTHSFYTLEGYLNHSWTVYCATKFLITLVLVLMFCICTLYKYSLIDLCLIYVLYL